MKKIFCIVFTIFISLSCSNSKTKNSYVDGNSLGYRPFELNAETSKFFIDDFSISRIKNVRWPKGLYSTFQKDSSIYRITGKMSRPLDLAKFNTGDRDISILIKQKYFETIQIEYKGNSGDSVYIFGSFNNWKRGSNLMRPKNNSLSSDKQDFTYDLNLSPGIYEFKFQVNGNERIDNTSPYQLVKNGSGSYNHKLVVNPPGEESDPLRVFDIGVRNFKGFSKPCVIIDSLPKNQTLYAFWNTSLISKELITHQNDGKFWIQLPKKSLWNVRNHLHIYSDNGSQISNDLLIPFSQDDVIKSVNELNRQDWEAATLYFLMVDRFANGNFSNDMPLKQNDVLPLADYLGGDLEGINKMIDNDYFEDFGFNTVWLSPITKNPKGAWGLWNKGGVKTKFSGYHGYWPISSTLPDNRLASKESISNLIETAHSRDLNVLLDYVANHVHLEHPVFKNNPDWATELYFKDGSTNTEKWDSHRLTTWFDNHLPTLDLRRPDVVNPMTDSAIIWLKDYGFDGFRHDATKHVDILFWRTLSKKIKNQISKKKNKRVFQIGETYGSPDLISSYLGPGLLDAQFDFNLYDAAVNFFAGFDNDSEKLKETLINSLNKYGYHHLMGNISGNQDKPRFISLASKEVSPNEDTKLAGYVRQIGTKTTPYAYSKLALLHAFNHAIPGVPIIYYGDEFGMPGANDPDNRRMMKFDGYSPEEMNLKILVRQIVQARRKHMALNYGNTEIISLNKSVINIKRSYLNEHIDIILNNSNLPFTIKIDSKARVIAGNGNLGIRQVTIPAFGFVYLLT